jgi:PAS domain S-box-containing protein
MDAAGISRKCQLTAPPSPADILKTTLQNCADEPIRIPGSIQRHGFLLLLDSNDQHVIAASQNTEEFLDVPTNLILGSTVDTVLDREILGALRTLTHSTENAGIQTYLGSYPLRGKFYSVVTHRVADERVLEFELLDRLVNPEMANQVFTNFVSKLTNLRSEQTLCDALAEQIKILTGFNRIMLYRFDEFGHGTVLSEVRDGALPSYLDLRFPASDIPQQARDLYILNTVRIIPDAAYVPSPLHAPANRQIASLDMSMCILRSVSPIHVEYMRNMGTMSSMSVSLICEGKLWGLVSGHHATPHMVPYLVRSACDLLAKLVCTQLMNFRSAFSLKKMVHFHSVQRRMLTEMAAENNYLAAMAAQMADVIQITDATGAALVVDGQYEVFGVTPTLADIGRLAAWMDSQPELELFHSRHLSREIPWAAKFSDVASGLLAIRISYIAPSYVLWFRPEVVRTVQWAGQPKDPTQQADRLSPRKSFDSWKELVHGRSTPWTEMEIESATEFRAAVTLIGLKRAEEAVQLGEARFLQLTHALPNPVWTAGDDGTLTYVNQRWLDQGLSPHGLWYHQELIAPDDQLRCEQAWSEAVTQAIPFELEVRFRSPSDQTDRWNLVHVVPYRSADGTLAGWVGSCTDLTDRRQREIALRMTEKLALTGRMTSVIAHEINNPLEAMTNLLYLLREHVQNDDSARSYISLAESELQRISGITRQTLRWSKENVRQAEYGTAGSLFKNVLRLFAGKIRNREVQVEIGPGEDIRFYGTIGQIEQVLANLISNAVQASPVGSRIWLNATQDGDMMEILVRDEGHGMSDETLRNLFQPFYSTKGDLGNGLGLYISHEIVERNAGTLTVTSKPGTGTEIRVRLPATAPSASELSS